MLLSLMQDGRCPDLIIIRVIWANETNIDWFSHFAIARRPRVPRPTSCPQRVRIFFCRVDQRREWAEKNSGKDLRLHRSPTFASRGHSHGWAYWRDSRQTEELLQQRSRDCQGWKAQERRMLRPTSQSSICWYRTAPSTHEDTNHIAIRYRHSVASQREFMDTTTGRRPMWRWRLFATGWTVTQKKLAR